jgi:hypothetical protein
MVMLVLSPLTGAWSDKVGAKPLVLFSTIAIGVLTLPLLAWLNAAPSLTADHGAVRARDPAVVLHRPDAGDAREAVSDAGTLDWRRPTISR